MADKKLNEVTKVTDMAYVPVIMADGSIGQIAKADLASVVAEQIRPLAFTGSSFGGDLNDAKESGIYDILKGATNIPTVTYESAAAVIVIKHDGSNVKQLYLGRQNEVFYRTMFNGTWDSWSSLLS